MRTKCTTDCFFSRCRCAPRHSAARSLRPAQAAQAARRSRASRQARGRWCAGFEKSVDWSVPRSGSISTSSAVGIPAAARLPLHHDRDRLVRDCERGGQFLAPDRLEADIHGDHDVDAHCLGDVHGQVLDDAAVHQQPAFNLDRREHARHRHARAHGGGQVAAARARCARRSRGPPRSRGTASAVRRNLDRGDRQRLAAAASA